MTLRPYQDAAISATYAFMRARKTENPCIEIPTAGGKTPIMARICQDIVTKWNGTVLILAHRRELLEQTAEKIHLVAPELSPLVGIYSAGLRKREVGKPITIAQIQSVYKRACELGTFSVVLVDEVHSIPEEGEGMYLRFLADARVVNPRLRVIGLTATPYRMRTGMICKPGNILNAISYSISVKDLIDQGFISKLTTKGSRTEIDTSGLHIRAGEFIDQEAAALMDTDALVNAACSEIAERTADGNSVLIFSTGVAHGQHIAAVLEAKNIGTVASVFEGTTSEARVQTIADFKARKIKYLINCEVFTVGFDATGIDCVALVRPTCSPGLYYQMVGRGFRLHEGKSDCLVLDFGGNVKRHGPIDAIRVVEKDASDTPGVAPMKQCPECQEIIYASVMKCPACGYVFPAAPTHDAKASDEEILSGVVTKRTLPVQNIFYNVHRKLVVGAIPTMRVTYVHPGDNDDTCEWMCFEHDGYALEKARTWWKYRTALPVPATCAEAVRVATSGALREPTAITIKTVSGEPFARITAHKFPDALGPDDPDSPAPAAAVPVPAPTVTDAVQS